MGGVRSSFSNKAHAGCGGLTCCLFRLADSGLSRESSASTPNLRGKGDDVELSSPNTRESSGSGGFFFARAAGLIQVWIWAAAVPAYAQ